MDSNAPRQKTSLNLWLLALLVLLALAAVAYFVFREDIAARPTAPATPVAVPTSPTAPPAAADTADTAAPVTPAELAAYATSQTNRPDYARHGLELLAATLADLADRDDLRTPAVGEKRDQLTSVLSRPDEATASLRPAFVAVAALLQAMQQQAYPTLEAPVNALAIQAKRLQDDPNSPAARKQAQDFFTRAADVLREVK